MHGIIEMNSRKTGLKQGLIEPKAEVTQREVLRRNIEIKSNEVQQLNPRN